MNNNIHTAAMIAVAAVCTFATRLVPFLLFGGKKGVPKTVDYLGHILPPAIMATLVVYCLKGVSLASASGWLPQALSVAAVAALHLYKRNNLISIAGGTLCYMALVQLVFK